MNYLSGYIDTRVRAWNGANTKERNGGKTYETMFFLFFIYYLFPFPFLKTKKSLLDLERPSPLNLI